ncbi:GroES-like protein [Mycena sanguinolenta]|uniref:GroES-like protein n=1 Tax=Mycena sanguinolenta TaxID=230812 RepID=A0A8H6U217_9AGAR|nr:GroES-like protein [Mycena sanguinolenta]
MSLIPHYPATPVALQLTEPKQKTALTLARVNIPEVLDGQEVLIKNGAAAQNPVEVDNGSIATLPWTNWGDVTGEVIALGKDVKTIQVGDRVASFLSRKTTRHSGYQEFSIGNAPQTFKVCPHFHEMSFDANSDTRSQNTWDMKKHCPFHSLWSETD